MKPPEDTPEAYVALMEYRPSVAAWAEAGRAVPSRPVAARTTAARRRRRRADLMVLLPGGLADQGVSGQVLARSTEAGRGSVALGGGRCPAVQPSIAANAAWKQGRIGRSRSGWAS